MTAMYMYGKHRRPMTRDARVSSSLTPYTGSGRIHSLYDISKHCKSCYMGQDFAETARSDVHAAVAGPHIMQSRSIYRTTSSFLSLPIKLNIINSHSIPSNLAVISSTVRTRKVASEVDQRFILDTGPGTGGCADLFWKFSWSWPYTTPSEITEIMQKYIGTLDRAAVYTCRCT